MKVPWLGDDKKSNDAFTKLTNIIQLAGLQIYAIIDEYDNFANTMLRRLQKLLIYCSENIFFYPLFSLSSPSQTNPKIAKNYESIIHQRQSAKEWQHCKTFETGYGRRG